MTMSTATIPDNPGSKSDAGARPLLAPWLSKDVGESVRRMHEERLETLLSVRDILHLTGWSRSTLYRRMRARKFPRPVRSGGWRIGFLASEVHAAFEHWKRERDAAAAEPDQVDH
jgi:predicted DNA-binding transcriptional regulator AlpA